MTTNPSSTIGITAPPAPRPYNPPLDDYVSPPTPCDTQCTLTLRVAKPPSSDRAPLSVPLRPTPSPSPYGDRTPLPCGLKVHTPLPQAPTPTPLATARPFPSPPHTASRHDRRPLHAPLFFYTASRRDPLLPHTPYDLPPRSPPTTPCGRPYSPNVLCCREGFPRPLEPPLRLPTTTALIPLPLSPPYAPKRFPHAPHAASRHDRRPSPRPPSFPTHPSCGLALRPSSSSCPPFHPHTPPRSPPEESLRPPSLPRYALLEPSPRCNLPYDIPPQPPSSPHCRLPTPPTSPQPPTLPTLPMRSRPRTPHAASRRDRRPSLCPLYSSTRPPPYASYEAASPFLAHAPLMQPRTATVVLLFVRTASRRDPLLPQTTLRPPSTIPSPQRPLLPRTLPSPAATSPTASHHNRRNSRPAVTSLRPLRRPHAPLMGPPAATVVPTHAPLSVPTTPSFPMPL